jgi:hypothetical protein
MASLEARAFFNESHRFDSYRKGDPLTPSRLAPLVYTDYGENNEVDNEWLRTCERVFQYLNADNRPNGEYERSLSVGDVVVVTCDGETRAFGCEPQGFRYLDPDEFPV